MGLERRWRGEVEEKQGGRDCDREKESRVGGIVIERKKARWERRVR